MEPFLLYCHAASTKLLQINISFISIMDILIGYSQTFCHYVVRTDNFSFPLSLAIHQNVFVTSLTISLPERRGFFNVFYGFFKVSVPILRNIWYMYTHSLRKLIRRTYYNENRVKNFQRVSWFSKWITVYVSDHLENIDNL